MLRVLSVGNCVADEGLLRRFFAQNFRAELAAVDDGAAALEALRREKFDLVLVNRLLDINGDSGLDVIGALKADAALAATPVMLLSNFPEWQTRAEALGALPGFGKAELTSAKTRERLTAALGQS